MENITVSYDNHVEPTNTCAIFGQNAKFLVSNPAIHTLITKPES
jgi:hypothetical protein